MASGSFLLGCYHIPRPSSLSVMFTNLVGNSLDYEQAQLVWLALPVLAGLPPCSGGSVVAEALGGQLISPTTSDPQQRRILNIVEEMAIASGTPVPPVYLMEEKSINAFAAGNSVNNAVVGITRGCAEKLNREQLQGVVAHEFSHILNGDMRLNIKLTGMIFGIVCLSRIGEILMRAAAFSGGGRRRKKDDGTAAILALGVVLFVLG